MDLKLKSLKDKLDICNEKMQVIDYIYYKYDNYLDNNIKEYISLKHTMTELTINNLIDDIDNIYKDLENNIIERIDNIQADIDRIRRKNKIRNKFINGIMSYVIMSLLMNNADICYNNDLQDEIDKYNKEIKNNTNNL
jgi:hypothetical protein